MTRFSLKIFLLLVMFQSLDCYSQNQKTDSIEVSKIASNFFDWYISSAKNHKRDEYNPVEIKSRNGMTTLDFSKYFKNLKKLSFSDSLLTKEKDSYNECIEKLSKVKYADYLKLTDLDQFEDLNDDFTNSYRWTGGQEMYDLYSVSSVSFKNNTAFIIGYLYFDNNGSEVREFKDEITMNLIYQNNKWQIIDIK